MNNVIMIGRTTKEIELKESNGGIKFCNFSLAVNRNFKNKDGEYDTDFINVVVFSATAELVDKYVNKGQLLAIQGRIQTRNYENDEGKRIYITEVVGTNIQFLESKKEKTDETTPYNFEDDLDDELPF